jgi:hypothetical protein
VSIAGDNQADTSAVLSAVAPHHESRSSGSAMPLSNRRQHPKSLNAPDPAEAAGLPAYPASIHLGSPARDLTGNWKLPDGSVDPHAFLEKEVVITISPKELAIEGPSTVEGLQGAEDVYTLFETPRLAPPLLLAQEYLFLVDRSGSMHSARIAQVRKALKIMVKSIPQPDSAMASFVSHRLVL